MPPTDDSSIGPRDTNSSPTDDPADLVAAITEYRDAGGEVPFDIQWILDGNKPEGSNNPIGWEFYSRTLRDFACEVLADHHWYVMRQFNGGKEYFLQEEGDIEGENPETEGTYPTRTAALAAGLRLVAGEKEKA